MTTRMRFQAERAPRLFILPGLLCDATMWHDCIDALGNAARCSIPEWGELDSIEAMAAYVLDTAQDEVFALAGHSMGGRVALEILRQAPGRVDRIALLDTGFHPLATGIVGEREVVGRQALLDTARTLGMAAMAQDWARGMVHPDRLGTAVYQQILAMVGGRSLASFEAQIHALVRRPDASGLLPSIACSTLLLCGRQDVWSPVERHREMQALIPGARLEIVEDCGHMSPIEQPIAVARAMVAWLQAPASREACHAT